MENNIFQRHEIKYLVDGRQRALIEQVFRMYMAPDPHGDSTICNVYYDTPDYRLIRHSLEKPVYKEKLRMRSYGPVPDTGSVFLELKKKYKGVVYKRRIQLPQWQAEAYMAGRMPLLDDSQIGREIDYFKTFYRDLEPAVFLCYDRSAYFSRTDSGLRATFDKNIRWRVEDMSLTAPAGGQPLLLSCQSLLEIKTAGAIPLWLVRTLTESGVQQSSFSKYGEAYKTICREAYKERIGVLSA